MSVEFSNAYQEILLENLMAIIKQNFVFQTQIKLTESLGKEKSDLEEMNKKLQADLNVLVNQIKDVETYKMRAEQNVSAHEEKSRIQTALNDTMKQFSTVKNQLEEKNKEINQLKEYIQTLEKNIPVSKMKKINPSYEPPVVETVNDLKALQVSISSVNSINSSEKENPNDGSSF